MRCTLIRYATYVVCTAFAALSILSCEDRISLDDTGLKGPVNSFDNTHPKLHSTVWTCVEFGSYPQAEVISGNNFSAVADYGIKDGDLIHDSNLFARLQQATWENDQTSIDGVRYIRTKAVSKEGHGHYYSETDDWHYFRCDRVKWRILRMEGREALLQADMALDCHVFNDVAEPTWWGVSSLREWMNAEMYNTMFSDEEKKAVLLSDVRNEPNPDYGTSSGATTKDYLYILSGEEIYSSELAQEYGFYTLEEEDDPARRFKPSMYAMCRGAWYSMADVYKGNTFWFMRTSGYNAMSVAYVCEFGFTYSRGDLVTTNDAGIIPVVRVDIDKAKLKVVGLRSSDDIVQPESPEEVAPIQEFTTVYKGLSSPVNKLDEALPHGHQTTWKCIEFGRYPQSEDNSKPGSYVTEPVRWRVLSLSGTTALLLADKVLDCHPFVEGPVAADKIDWKHSSLRQWMNTEMYDKMFTDEEKAAMLDCQIANVQNYYFGTDCGQDTQDKMFILSEQETFSTPLAKAYGFLDDDGMDDPARRFVSSDYARAQGAWCSEEESALGNAFWMLRSAGYSQQNVVYVCEYGYIYNRGINVRSVDAGVLPAIKIDLSKADYQMSGKVNSNDILKD